jgi:hypothetical protein
MLDWRISNVINIKLLIFLMIFDKVHLLFRIRIRIHNTERDVKKLLCTVRYNTNNVSSCFAYTLVGVAVFCCANGVLGVFLAEARGVGRRLLSSSTFCAMEPAPFLGVRNPNTSLPVDSPASCNCLDFLPNIQDVTGAFFQIHIINGTGTGICW